MGLTKTSSGCGSGAWIAGWLSAAWICLPGPALAEPTADTAAKPTLDARLEALQERDDVPRGSRLSVAYLVETAERIDGRFPAEATAWRERAAAYLTRLEAGEDPFPQAKGEIVQRGYTSPVSQRLQGYALYLPPNYDPEKPHPLVVVLHGGSSNGNLFLGVVLGNNMNWKEYDQHLWDDYTPRWSPDCIVVAPDGFGQVMWRFMGERDVLDVIADVLRHYSVDEDRIVLSGLSNGGVGAYALAARRGHWFSVVQAIAGAPSWLQYTGERRVVDPERPLVSAWSALSLLPNLEATDFRYYHGHTDPGPMRPAFVEAFDAAVKAEDVQVKGTWYDAGHDLLYRVLRHGRSFEQLTQPRRDPSPKSVHLRSFDLRAARQHWLTITRFAQIGEPSEARAQVEGSKVQLQLENVAALSLDLRTLPRAEGPLQVFVGDQQVLSAPRDALGARVHLRQREGSWEPGFPEQDGLHKRKGLSGPISDAYYTRMIHVYGTQNDAHTAALKRAAERGANGWPKWLWGVQQEVMADREVSRELARQATLVLYGTPGDNAWLDAIAPQLPIRVTQDAVQVGPKRVTGPDVGVRFIYPNPRAPQRYVVVQAATTPRGVALGHNLPDFVPDYVVYDAKSARRRPRLVPGRPAPDPRGLFDTRWRLRLSGP